MENELNMLLKEYGLDNNEIKIYLYLVCNKELTAYEIAKENKIHRSTCYDVLERLITKGFVNKIEKKNKSYYYTNDISRVISQIKDKETILLSLVPKIQNLEQNKEVRIRILEDIGGQKQFNYSLFNLAKNNKISFCYTIGNTYASTLSSNIFIERLIKELKSSKFNEKIEYKGIWDEKYKGDKLISQYNQLGENRFLKVLPSKVGTIICDEFIAFLYTTDKPYVVEIKNTLVAEEMKAYFENLWKSATK